MSDGAATRPGRRLPRGFTSEMLDQLPVITGREQIPSDLPVAVENHIGSIQVPLGVAGPLTIHGKHQEGTFFAPLATTEAALVASCSRGCKALQQSGGAHAVALQAEMHRAPKFVFANMDDAVNFYMLVPSLEEELRTAAQKASNHAKLLRVTPHLIGAEVHIKFSYSTGDACGQNMVTIATHRACQIIVARKEELRFTRWAVEGQMTSDKKYAVSNMHEPRGTKVTAWATITDETCRKFLGCTTDRFHTAITATYQAAVRAGTLGMSANASNIMAAMFIACGQDAASLFEAGWAQFTSQRDPETGTLTLSIHIPSLPVGTIGGGCSYPTQSEALRMLNCGADREGGKLALAESIAAFCLALDISTISALITDTFTNAHANLRKKEASRQKL